MAARRIPRPVETRAGFRRASRGGGGHEDPGSAPGEIPRRIGSPIGDQIGAPWTGRGPLGAQQEIEVSGP